MRTVFLVLIAISTVAWAADPPPPPSKTSTLGMTVTNPATAGTTTVSGFVFDPDGVTIAFVKTADGYTFLVKDVGEFIWNGDNPPQKFKIISKDTTAKTVMLSPEPADPGTTASTLGYQVLSTDADLVSLLNPPMGTDGDAETTIVSGSPSGVKDVRTGKGGSNGRAGALVVPPTSGGDGATGPTVNLTNNIDIGPTNQIGIEAGSIGGKGGNGGNSYLSFWSGRDGGDGGAGGTVIVTNNRQVATTGTDHFGIYAYSRSGAAGNGGSGWAAPGGGTGGHSSNGGSVTVTNNGNVSTTGNGAYGIYGLSVSGNGGTGGSQWGLVGQSGSGGFGGSGGPVTITNGVNGTIHTSGNVAHGIYAESVGGSGGNSGTSGNLILSLQGDPDNGGTGGTVTVTNHGSITTTGNYSRGIFAQSIGGGGGSGGTSFGLVSLGGSGSGGGGSGPVTVRNMGTGTISTSGIGSDGIFAQSVGGSGGSGSNSFGLVAVGGSGSKAGNGGVVTVENFGEIATTNNGARGIVAQSIGGGGGDGGSSGGAVSVGGGGSGGGSGAKVTVKHGGSITTDGNDATAILAQSVGGGGGNGGSAGSVSAFVGVAVGGKGGTGGAGGTVEVTLQGKDANTASVLRTDGDRSMGLFAQSVGGGGGNGGGAWQVTGGAFGAVSIAVGGKGGVGGAGGTVTVLPGTGGTSIVETDGEFSTGIFLQSVGGGGGNGGYSVSVAVAGGPVGGSLSIGVGGTAGAGGNGGTVTVGSYDGVGALTAAESGFNGSIITRGDRSTGFLAQSVGGGGGNGGSSVSAAAAGGVIGAASVSVGVGGDGGSGGTGGTVTVGTNGNVTTEGGFSPGMLVQSVGGGGGNGGGSVSGALAIGGTGALSVGIGLGGDAGNGNVGGEVKFATLGGTVTTGGESSTAITAQSIGGGGGTGGYSVSLSGAGAGVAGGAVSVGLGGGGGTGGHGGKVTTNLQSDVVTTGINSTGILVQSVGGGGGNGGFNVTVGLAGAGTAAGSVGVGLGGSGGAAGTGGEVNATSTGTIDTTGDKSGGFVAQSVGGGGGNGGFNVTGTIAGAGTGSGGVSVGLGGGGGGGGKGGKVTASTSGDVVTRGDHSTGILAQSVGGGGGNGGFNVSVALSGAGTGSGAVGVGLGGSGAAGADGSTVDLTVNNDVDTGTASTGDYSPGVIAQSIGGGGGNGGFNVTVAGSGAGTGSGSAGVGIGGSGAGGGHGDRVGSGMTGNITTKGDNSGGLLVQSVGGGGGNGGFNVTAALSFAGTGSAGASVGLGGSAGTGGDGGSVTSTLNGDVSTSGDFSTGVVAQSLGGGGGNGGFSISGAISGAGTGSGAVSVGLGGAGGSGGNSGRGAIDRVATVVVSNTVTGDVTTTGIGSGGVLAQSLGGGGGNGGFNISGSISGAGTGSGTASVGIGGSGGGGGDSAAVMNSVSGDVNTGNTDAFGILAQSVGGGGGNGGFNIAGNISGAGTGSFGVGVGIGGSGGGGGDSGNVSNTVVGDVNTDGVRSNGVTAQSLGGGGGNGGFNVTGTISGAGTGSGAVSVGIGGSGGSGGDSAMVTNSVTGDVTTTEEDSVGIMAQSVGGGGGTGAFNVSGAISGAGTGSGGVSVGIGGSGGSGGHSGIVDNTVVGDVSTTGIRSSGVVAQSLGGGGGNGGFNVSAALSGAGTGSGAVSVGIGGSGGGGGYSDMVTNSVTGDVTTEDDDSVGIMAQSVGGGGGNGGFNVSGAISVAGKGSGGVGVGVGGSGGLGGDSGIVDNTVVGDVSTTGIRSSGIVAQSLGGGGGNGAFNITAAISGAGTGTGAVSVGVGGSGGGGGESDAVINSVTGDVFTSNTDSLGILAQSVGGGGGTGGMNISAAVGLSKTGAGALAVGVGGSGGLGGDAGNVTSTVSGYVQTTGLRSAGITTQSVGGGGGTGGLNISGVLTGAKTGSGGLAVGVGGLGGDGGDSAGATSTVTGGVVTTGDESPAIFTQSLGGGGGNGGTNVTAAVNLTKENGGTLGVGVGGFGGGGGNAGDVMSTVTTTEEHNQIGTTGDDSSGVTAQSLGGGGGNGGVNVTGSVNLTGKNGAAVGVGVGGFGGGAGNAGDVTVNVTGSVVTEGNNSHGLLAQSIGGAGGNGGTNVTGTLAFTNSSSGSAKTISASIGIGGFGGGGGMAGDVDVTYEGTIVAQPRVFVPESIDPDTAEVIPAHYEFKAGMGSHGLAAQSIGGGGGNGAVNVSAGISFARSEGDGYGLIVGFGGFGGDGGDAGTVDVTVNGGGSIFSYGAGHSAMLAQSLGGGGGNGGLNVSGGIVSDSALIVGVGGFAGDAGIAKDVTVNAVTNVYAGSGGFEGVASAGLLAQSLGGGGGNGGLNVSGGLALSKEGAVPSITVGVGGFGGAGAISGDVMVDHAGNVVTAGDWVHGVMAQSIAGGGGNGGMNVSGQVNFADSDNSGGKTDLTVVAGIGGNGGLGADAGDVSVTQNGIVMTMGENARGVAAQSIGGGGGNGGMNVTGVFAKNSSPISVGVGGSGSGGGHAGFVLVNRGGEMASTGKVSTDGSGSYGVEASSIGGGGGDAGMNFIIGVSLAGADGTDAGFAAQFAIGGGGGEAGNGGAAEVNNYSDIETVKDNSHGILAQSIGGGGGNANFNLAVTYAGKSKKNMGFNLAIGGAPGDGGDGAAVDVVQVGTIETHGKNSFGILAQSVGGGGGNAGMDFAFIKADGGKAGITLGRMGGTGGVGADVTLSSTGTVLTHGDGSFGLLAQSVGNGGGNSSSTTVGGEVPSEPSSTGETTPHAVAVSVGLEGGMGGRAGNVTLDAAGFVTTEGFNAHAIFAQSVGGGGGNGGSANTAGLTAASASLSLGGTGGEGGIGGIVMVTSSADVRTFDADSVGILAQSVGGGGGNGGMASAGGLKSGDSGINVTVGGAGGTGMSGGVVTVSNSGVVITDGDGSHGVLAQSLGGGGGNSGMSINTIVKPSTDSPTRVAITIGGDGGEGGVGGAVTVTNTGGIGTSDANSIGIFAQSIGGGGGNSKNVVSNYASAMGSSNNIQAGIGGTGGVGAAGGTVSVFNLKGTDEDSGKIITLGNYSHGILAMSVGGGGGTGSTTMSINRGGAATSTSTANSALFSLGGAGGEGGTGGDVDVTNTGEITTYGYAAHGILAQSVGGGGGQGGMSITGELALGSKSTEAPGGKAGALAIGGAGGSGNRSGDVTVSNSGTIEVFGNRAFGIYAQSVGGGGGDGGWAATLSRNILKNPKTDLQQSLSNLGIGGSGGDGADSGNVLVTHTGTILSHGDNSYGIFAQAVGGGGGNGAHALTSPAWMAADLVFSALLGSRDGSMGTAGTVTIDTTGDIIMMGQNSQAQLGQSVNGGGGNVDLFLDVSKHAVALGDDGIELPNNGGDVDAVKAFISSTIELGTTFIANAVGSAIDATHLGDLYAFGKNSTASVMQSIGGGGGNANTETIVDSQADVDLVAALGGMDATGSGGGDVHEQRTGDVGTAGAQSQGVNVQSIGGGGGSISASVVRIPDPPATASAAGLASASALSATGSANAHVSLGADGSTGNDGGDMVLDYDGTVSTSGDLSTGLVVQSIGAGGGQAVFTGMDSVSTTLGATGISSGNGGDIDITNAGAIATEGKRSDGIIIQTIGGGGGLVLTDLDAPAVTVDTRTDNFGDGGDIRFTQSGDIMVSGDGSIGVIAQSLGGGGGIVDRVFMDRAGGAGRSGSIDVSLDGDVVAGGQDGVGVFAQSRSSSLKGDIEITLAEGRMLYFGPHGTGAWFSGGTDNSFVNNGTVAGADGLTAWGVRGEEGNESVLSRDLFVGQFDLGPGTNSFTNAEGATFIAGPELLLGDSRNLLTQSGIMYPGDRLTQRGILAGSFAQTATGATLAELDFGSADPNRDGGLIDQILATGTVTLDGRYDVTLLNPQVIPYGHFQKTIFGGAMGVVDAGMVLTTAPSVVITYDLLYPTGNDAVLDYNVDFAPMGLGPNLRGLGEYFNRIQAAGSSESLADVIVKLVFDPDLMTYAQTLSQMSPDVYGELQSHAIEGSERFGQLMLGRGGYRAMEGENRVWFQLINETTTHEAFDDYKRTDHYDNGISFGVESLLKEDWRAGIGISFEEINAHGYNSLWDSEGRTQRVGIGLRNTGGPVEFGGEISYSRSVSDVTRRGMVIDPFTATLDRDMHALTAMVGASHEVRIADNVYARFGMDLGTTYLQADAANESGAGALNLMLKDYSETHVWGRPTVDVGYRSTPFGPGLRLHVFTGVGVQQYFTDPYTDVVADFEGAPSGASSMRVPVPLSQTEIRAALGIELLAKETWSVGVQFNKSFSEHTDIDFWSFNFRLKF